MIIFTIPGRVAGKGRPRVTVRGKFAHAYTPAKTRNVEAMVRDFGAKAMGERPPLEGPLVLEMLVILNTPQSWSKKRRAGTKWVTGKPDADNQIKILDALNGVVWRDDSQVCKILFERRYDDAAPEHVMIRVYTPGRDIIEAIAA